MESLNNKDKMLIIVMWRSEIIRQAKSDLSYDMNANCAHLSCKQVFMPDLAPRCSI